MHLPSPPQLTNQSSGHLSKFLHHHNQLRQALLPSPVEYSKTSVRTFKNQTKKHPSCQAALVRTGNDAPCWRHTTVMNPKSTGHLLHIKATERPKVFLSFLATRASCLSPLGSSFAALWDAWRKFTETRDFNKRGLFPFQRGVQENAVYDHVSML